MKKKLTMVAALVLVFALGVTGTLAYLTAKTDSITNTFTVGNVNITLTETANESQREFKLIPGTEYAKNPIVTVKAGSEKCYLFVKLVETGTPDSYLSWDNALDDSEWLKLTDVANVYYRVVDTSESDQSFHLIDGDKVTVLETVGSSTLPMPSAAPTLTYTAYAIQFANMDDADDAWTTGNFS